MPKQSLNEVKSSPVLSNQRESNNLSDQRKKKVSNTISAPSFFEHYLNCDCIRKCHQLAKDDEIQDKKRGLFRNRLFSTWTGNAEAYENGAKTTARCCDNSDRWNEEAARKPSARKESIGETSLREDEDVDGGYAWIILIVMFVINGSTFGTARAYGLIFENSARRDEQSRSEAALPFTIMGAVENMAGPLTGYLLARTGSWRVVVFVGSCLITLSHLLAAYFDSQLGQILTIGLMCGIGQSFVSVSSFQINNAYFVRYRSRAFGISLTGAAIGTFYISPLCQFVLDNHTKSLCYLMLSLILLPNVLLSLLLKPKGTPIHLSDEQEKSGESDNESMISANGGPTMVVVVGETAGPKAGAQLEKPTAYSISSQLVRKQSQVRQEVGSGDKGGFWRKVVQVLSTPLFHLIWPTQLLFCWLNFVFGMIITDFGKDRGLSETQNSHLIVIWASGQLFGRLCLGSLVDLRILSYRSFTVLCFASIGSITLVLNKFGTADQDDEMASNSICLLVFILSMFISTLYILFNSLVVNYMDKSLAALSVGISSFTGSFFLLPRANIIGYYRDTCGNYDSMLSMFTIVTMLSALVWLIIPALCSHLGRCNSAAGTGISQVRQLLDDCSLSGNTISSPSSGGKPDVRRLAEFTDEEHLSSNKPVDKKS